MNSPVVSAISPVIAAGPFAQRRQIEAGHEREVAGHEREHAGGQERDHSSAEREQVRERADGRDALQSEDQRGDGGGDHPAIVPEGT